MQLNFDLAPTDRSKIMDFFPMLLIRLKFVCGILILEVAIVVLLFVHALMQRNRNCHENYYCFAIEIDKIAAATTKQNENPH